MFDDKIKKVEGARVGVLPEDVEDVETLEALTVYVGCFYRIVYASLCHMLERHNFKISVDSHGSADVALIDLSHLSPPYPPPATMPTLALIKGSFAGAKAVVSSGYRGYLTQDSDPDLLPKALRAIAKGELWIERKVMSELFDYQSGPRLTHRELEIQALLEQGLSNQKIAEHLHISVSTVKAHITSLLNKLNAKSRLELATRRSKNQP